MEEHQRLTDLISTRMDAINDTFNQSNISSINSFKRKIFNTLEKCYKLTSEKEILQCEQTPLFLLENYSVQSLYLRELALHKLHSCVQQKSNENYAQTLAECINTTNVESKYADKMSQLLNLSRQEAENIKI